MSRPDATLALAQGAGLTGRWLVVARALWLLLAILSLSLLIVAIPARYQQLSSLSGSALPEGWSQPAFRNALGELGISTGFYATYQTIIEVTVATIASAIALAIFWRRSREWPALLISLWLVSFSTSSPTQALESRAVLGIVHDFLDQIGWVVLLPFVFFTFPDGRFVPRWTRWLGLAWLLFLPTSAILEALLGIENGTPTPMWVILVWMSVWVAGALAQIYRYLRVSNPRQRQQTKWVLFGMSGTVTILVAFGLSTIAFPWLEELLPRSLLYEHLIGSIIISLGFLLIPLSIGVAILRYRLWDIDIIVNRTLVYGILTGLLALIYFGSVTLLQSVFAAVSGQKSPVAIVVSTLVIAALSAPLRRRIQEIIDRRFYRRKYDAAQALARFAQTARGEVELDALAAELVRVVEETMQPESVSLWLKEKTR